MSQPEATERGADVRFPPPAVYLATTLLGVAAGYLIIPATIPVGRAISITIGVLLIVSGLAFIVPARVRFTRTGQSPIPWKPSPELILSGPYRFTRNPMYVGITFVEIGLGIAVNNLWISFFALPALLTVHFIAVLPEERYLSGKFGESYRTYLTRVRRYL